MVYEGKEKYIFVSYAHKDAPEVLPIIERLAQEGFRVWYDSGIEAGTEWPEYIESHICDANVLLVFMTPATIESRNCRNEINYALELKKEVLVVYLQETTLLKGMRLQLSSTQSLFRKNHASNETFLKELINAKILQGCRTGEVEVNNIFNNYVRSDFEERTIIEEVCSIGSNDSSNPWPEGDYSEVINRDEHRVMHFHMILEKEIGISGKVSHHYQIYNEDDQLVFEDDGSLEVEPDYDTFATGWILKGGDGSFVPSGKYRFLCSINDSPVVTYYFWVESNDEKVKKPEVQRESNTRISNICSIGTNDVEDVWPQGTYSQTINRQEFDIIYFHISLLKPLGISGPIVNQYKYYNSDGDLVFETENTIDAKPEYDRVSTGWIINRGDGSFTPPGRYRFEASINGSPVFKYYFTIEDKDTGVRKHNYTTDVTKNAIANICSIGTNDTDDVWPKGIYSEVINRDEFRVVYFHIIMLREFGFSGKITNKYRIYNSRNQVVFDDVSELDIQPDYDRISTGWILKGTDGSFVPSGDYRFEASINGSDIFTYNFRVTSNYDTKSKDQSVFGLFKNLFS